MTTDPKHATRGAPADPLPDTETAAVAAAHDLWRQWCERRQAALAGPESWCGLIGLTWLVPGDNPVGSGVEEGAGIPLPGEAPARVGVLHWSGQLDDGVVWRPAAGVTMAVEDGQGLPLAGDAEGAYRLTTDRQGAPHRVAVGPWRFFLIERAGRIGVRLRDQAWATRGPVPQLAWYPYAPAWRIRARWERLATPREVEVPSVSGELSRVQVTHCAEFSVPGEAVPVRLLPNSLGKGTAHFVFRDQGSGRESYGAGRFVEGLIEVAGPEEEWVILDFNRAYNPPCAFTDFATCPLPPPENWLPFRVPAGELKPAFG